MVRKISFAIAILLSSYFCFAADQIAVKAGRLIDVRTGNVTQNAVIVIANGHIASIGSSVPTGATVIDLSAYTVLPGLIDCHAHLLLNWKDLSSVQSLRLSSGQATIWGIHNLQTYMNNG